MNRLIFMLQKAPRTWGDKHERETVVYLYNPHNSSFEMLTIYGRIRDAWRGLRRLAKTTPFSITYLAV